MKIRPRQIASTSAFAFVLALSGSAFAQQVQCTPPASLCNNMAGRPLYGEAAGGATCPPGTQIPISVCDERLPRLGYQTAGTSTIRPGQRWVVQAEGPTTQRTVVVRQDPRYRLINGRLVVAEENIQALDHNAQVDRGRLELYNQQSINRDLILAGNDRVLAQRNQVTEQHVNEVGFQVGQLRAETRYRVFTPFRASWQSGGSPVIATAGVGFGFTKYGQGSDWGLDFSVAVNGYANQPLAPGVLPLFNLWSSIGAAYGRGSVQGVFDLQLSLTGRFGDANQGEVTGPTQGDVTLGAGVRFETPLRPVSRPDGARFYGTLRGGMGVGFSQAVVAGQPPLHVGLTLTGMGILGIAL